MVTDPIADMLTRIRNANAMRYKEVDRPHGTSCPDQFAKALKQLR